MRHHAVQPDWQRYARITSYNVCYTKLLRDEGTVMKGLYTKGQHQQSGTTLVEFTIVATLFFILLFSIIEFSRLLYVWHGLNETSRRTARLAAVCSYNFV